MEINSGGCLYKDTEEDPWQAILEMLNLFCSLILSKNLGTCMHFKTKEKNPQIDIFFYHHHLVVSLTKMFVLQ